MPKYLVHLHQPGGCDYMLTECGTKVITISAQDEESAIQLAVEDLFDDWVQLDYLTEMLEYVVGVYKIDEEGSKSAFDLFKSMTNKLVDNAREEQRKENIKRKEKEIASLEKKIAELKSK